MKGLDLRKFKKVSSDEHATVLQHPHGHEIKIAHKNLKGELKKQLDSLPHLYTGGDVPDSPESQLPLLANEAEDAKRAEAPTEPPFPAESKASGENIIESATANIPLPGIGAPMPMPEPEQPNIPGLERKQPQEQQAVQPMQGNPLMQAMQTQMGGIQAEARAQGELGKQQADIYAQQQQKMEQLHNDFQQRYANLDQERQNIMHDIANGHIDPERYMNRMSGVEKVSTAIGLILGGMGGGLTHQENPALKFLNAQIDRDIDAQRAELNSKHNLLGALQQQFGNLKDASMMAKAVYADMYASKIAEAAAKSADPMAKARAQQAIGQLQAQVAPVMQELSMRQAVLGGMRSGQVDYEQAVPFLVPKEHQAKAFEELKEHRLIQNAVNTVTKSMQEVAQLQSAGSRLGSPVQSKSKIDALNLQIDSLAKEMFGKVSDQEIELLKNAKVKFTDNPATVSAKIKTLQDSLAKRAVGPTVKAFMGQEPHIQTNRFTPHSR